MFERLIDNDQIENSCSKSDIIYGLIRYFMVTFNSETSKYAQTLLKEGITDQNLIPRKEIIEWFDSN